MYFFCIKVWDYFTQARLIPETGMFFLLKLLLHKEWFTKKSGIFCSTQKMSLPSRSIIKQIWLMQVVLKTNIYVISDVKYYVIWRESRSEEKIPGYWQIIANDLTTVNRTFINVFTVQTFCILFFINLSSFLAACTWKV